MNENKRLENFQSRFPDRNILPKRSDGVNSGMGLEASFTLAKPFVRRHTTGVHSMPIFASRREVGGSHLH